MSAVTANETPTIHDSLGSFIEHGVPGDVFHDLPTGSDRSVETYVLKSSRTVGEGESSVHHAGEIVAEFLEIRTTHHGRPQLAGRPEYMYRSATMPNSNASTEPGGMFIRRVFSVGGEVHLTLPDTPAKRYGKAKLLSIHRDALVAEGITTEGV